MPYPFLRALSGKLLKLNPKKSRSPNRTWTTYRSAAKGTAGVLGDATPLRTDGPSGPSGVIDRLCEQMCIEALNMLY